VLRTAKILRATIQYVLTVFQLAFLEQQTCICCLKTMGPQGTQLPTPHHSVTNHKCLVSKLMCTQETSQ